MAKDRNTFAKQQREVERKRKATEKREQRKGKKQPSEKESTPTSSSSLSTAQLAVLEVYRKFRMGSGQMLCFSTADVAVFHEPLTQLADNGLLVAEKFQGGYSLTQAGFAAMRDGA